MLDGTINRTAPNPETRDFARRLLAYEAAEDNSSEADMPAVFRVAEKLRRPLSRLAGANGFRSLLARALALAKTQSHSLAAVQVNPDGLLEGLNGLHDDAAAEAGAILIAYLLGLLITFIGENLTVRLVRDVWPDLLFGDGNSGEKSDYGPTR